MAKKSKKKTAPAIVQRENIPKEFSPGAENDFKKILRVMSWIVGICFILIIILPNFNYHIFDNSVKYIFYFGVINLLLFALFEFFASPFKKLLDKRYK